MNAYTSLKTITARNSLFTSSRRFANVGLERSTLYFLWLCALLKTSLCPNTSYQRNIQLPFVLQALIHLRILTEILSPATSFHDRSMKNLPPPPVVELPCALCAAPCPFCFVVCRESGKDDFFGIEVGGKSENLINFANKKGMCVCAFWIMLFTWRARFWPQSIYENERILWLEFKAILFRFFSVFGSKIIFRKIYILKEIILRGFINNIGTYNACSYAGMHVYTYLSSYSKLHSLANW